MQISNVQVFQPILRIAALREIEAQQHALMPSLMERAGAAAVNVALQLLAGSANPERPPLVIAGPGNNGGDAFVVARLLHQKGLKPVVVFAGMLAQLPADAQTAYQAWMRVAADSTVHAEIPVCAPGAWGVVIDGLFGIGLTRPLEGRYAALVAQINALDCPCLALDLPSGLDSETGRVLGACVRATHTASFLGFKVGLLTLDGPDHAGNISVHDLGVDLSSAPGQVVGRILFADCLKPRWRNSHKGSHGSVGILGGAPGMAGAALLAGRAALRLGAGKVYLGMLECLSVDVCQPELMLRSTEEVLALSQTAEPVLEGCAGLALVIGPGLGQSAMARELLQQTIMCTCPLLLDADALNLLAAHPALCRLVSRRGSPTVLTPHPAEAARLLGCAVSEIQADRLRAALSLAKQFCAHVVLKGCGSVVACPDGRWFINATGNPALASAGTGDVLSGMNAALLAQGWPSEQALLAAVHLHGAAADDCVAAGQGPIGLTATELLVAGRGVLNRWVAGS